MSYSINGELITRGRLTLRLAGAWDAELWLGSDIEVAGPAVVDVAGVQFVGTATSGKDSGNRVSVRVVGGAGGLSSTVTAIAFAQATRGTILQAALGSGGETLSPLSDSTVTGGLLAHWSIASGTVAEAVRRLVEHASATWRVLPDGTIWVGVDVFPPVEPEHVLISESPVNQRLVVAVDTASILPGTTFRGRHVSSVEYTISHRSMRASVSYAEGRDDLAGGLSALVRRESAGRDLERTFAARVVAQNADGTLELRPTDPKMPGLSRVPVRLGLPGVTGYQVIPGIDCSLEYENGDPSKPFVSSFGRGQALTLGVGLTSLTVSATDIQMGGSEPLVKFAALQAWVAALTVAGAPLGLSVPALVAANTTILKGS